MQKLWVIDMEYFHYELHSETLCIGERIKKGTFRPTIETIPYTQISGALKAYFGRQEVHAVGSIVEYESKDYFTYSPRNRITNVSKIPITTEYLINVRGNVYILKNKETEDFPDEIEIKLGAMRTKGFGYTILRKKGLVEVRNGQLDFGKLNTRIPIEHLDKFLIKPVKPRYGYLIKPLSLSKAVYVLSLFEGSEVYAPGFLIEKRW